MTTKMLIDARHREETRVAVVKGNRIEEFDFESAERKQLKGNIYLAKVTRVEPSLQAAFVDYGGNRHGFLAFSEIHPDYYQIPKEDRDALLREEAEHAAEEAALRDGDDDDALDESDDAHDAHDDDARDDDDDRRDDDGRDGDGGEESPRRAAKRGGNGSDDTVEALRQRRMSLRRRYKIQDVIRRRQILLVQVVKEERGNKGAALTTYLSLAGRYCVLMPNTAHGGGISRKISNAADRKRLKSIMADLKLPPSMGCIVRTAGLQRTKTEIKRDFDYLARLWDEIRDKTLQSSAPALVYGDSDLIKRAIRDIYNRDIDEVIVEGADGFRHAKDFMKLLMPSHARRVKHYADPVPLFQRHHVEDQLAAMYHPVVQLKSGGYLVINPTEALVSIDINSGRATREHNIEQTATQTNLEAAEEIARQLRLRDMAGLVVIDFIDMDNGSNVRKVEKAMKEALKNDRARIQVGRISSFGLMEMSRQRLRTGVLEASTRQCPHCEGTGLVRTASSAGLSALRLLEDEAARGRGSQLLLRASQEAAFYLLNRKRAELAEIEERYGVTIEVAPDGEREGARMAVEVSGPPPVHAPRFEPVLVEPEEDEPEIEAFDEEEEEEAAEREPREAREPRESERGDRDGARRKRRRRRGRRGRRGDEVETGGEAEAGGEGEDGELGEAADAAGEAAPSGAAEGAGEADDGNRRARRRRNRRRRGRGTGEGAASDFAGDEFGGDAPADEEMAGDAVAGDADDGDDRARLVDGLAGDFDAAPRRDAAPAPNDPALADAAAPSSDDAAPKPKRARRKKADAGAAETLGADAEGAAPDTDAAPKRTRRKKAETVDAPEGLDAAPVEADAAKPKRTRRKKAEPIAEVTIDTPPSPAEAPGETPARAETAPEAAAALAAPAAGAEPAETLSAQAPAGETLPADAPAGETRPAEAPVGETGAAPAIANDDAGTEPPQPRRGWWQRTFGN